MNIKGYSVQSDDIANKTCFQTGYTVTIEHDCGVVSFKLQMLLHA